MATIYEAVPLSLGNSTNIRLFTILLNEEEATNPNGSISCELHLVDKLDKAAGDYAYTALSYVWGNPAINKSILLNGQEFMVRENLWNFLDQMRKEHCQGFLWIDAICIDQTQNDERSHQVAMMGQIYSRADQTFLWLGLQTEGLSQVFEMVANNTAPEDRLIPITKGLQELCQHEYWTRIWVVQEFLLSRSVIVRCGPMSSEACKFHKVMQIWFEFLIKPTYKFSLFKPIWGTHRSMSRSAMISFVFMRDNGQEKQEDLIELITRFAHLGCADVRDRVYALLGLVGQEYQERTTIMPDYTQSCSDLFAKVLLTRFEIYGTLGVKDFTAFLLHSLALELDDEVVRSVVEEMNRRKLVEEQDGGLCRKQSIIGNAVEVLETYFRFGVGSRRPVKRVSERSIRFLLCLVAVKFPNVRDPRRRVQRNGFFRAKYKSG